MYLFLRVLLVGLQVLTVEVFCDYANDKRLLEEYNSKLFVSCFPSESMFLDRCLDMSVRCYLEVNSLKDLKSRHGAPGRMQHEEQKKRTT